MKSVGENVWNGGVYGIEASAIIWYRIPAIQKDKER